MNTPGVGEEPGIDSAVGASTNARSASEPEAESSPDGGPHQARNGAEEGAASPLSSPPSEDAPGGSEGEGSAGRAAGKTAKGDEEAGIDPAADASTNARSTSEPETESSPDTDTNQAGTGAVAEEAAASRSPSPSDDASGESSEGEDSEGQAARKATKVGEESGIDPASDPASAPSRSPASKSAEDPADPSPQPRLERQGEMPFALVEGEPMTVLPKDLYIPPQALEIFLEAFEGPLDLLLYLIKRKNLDILDVPIAEITLQYMEYIDLMKELQLELAAEYMVMAATLAEIKSRMLLPRSESVDEEEDPRAELVRRLQEYERYKEAAARLEQMPRVGRDFVELRVDAPVPAAVPEPPAFRLDDLITALSEVLARAKMYRHYQVRPEPLSVRERMSIVLDRVQKGQKGDFVEFTTLFTPQEGRQGVVVTFLALLELLRESLVELVQARPFGPIHVKATGE